MDASPTKNHEITMSMSDRAEEMIESLLYDSLELQHSVFKNLSADDFILQEKQARSKNSSNLHAPAYQQTSSNSKNNEQNESSMDDEQSPNINISHLYKICKKTSSSIESLSQCYYKMRQSCENKSETTNRDDNKIQQKNRKKGGLQNNKKVIKTAQQKEDKLSSKEIKAKKIQKSKKTSNDEFTNRKIQKMMLQQRVITSRVSRKSLQQNEMNLSKSLELVSIKEPNNFEENQNYVSQLNEEKYSNLNGLCFSCDLNQMISQDFEMFSRKAKAFDPFQEQISFQANNHPLLELHMHDQSEGQLHNGIFSSNNADQYYSNQNSEEPCFSLFGNP